MRQVKVSLDENSIALFEREAQKSGRSFSEEIRQRLTESLILDEVRPDIARLEDDINLLIAFTELQCRHKWSEHAATARVLQLAVHALFARYGALEGVTFGPGELPEARIVAPGSDDPAAIATGIEAVVHATVDQVNQKLPDARKQRRRHIMRISEIRRRGETDAK